MPLATLLSSHLGAAIAGTFACAACFAVYYIATAFALGFGTTALKIDREIFLAIQLGAILAVVELNALLRPHAPRPILGSPAAAILGGVALTAVLYAATVWGIPG